MTVMTITGKDLVRNLLVRGAPVASWPQPVLRIAADLLQCPALTGPARVEAINDGLNDLHHLCEPPKEPVAPRNISTASPVTTKKALRVAQPATTRKGNGGGQNNRPKPKVDGKGAEIPHSRKYESRPHSSGGDKDALEHLKRVKERLDRIPTHLGRWVDEIHTSYGR